MTDDQTAEDQLRAHVRRALATHRVSQAEACRQLGLSQKHLSQMLTGKAPLTLTWAEGLLGLCQMSLVIDTRPDQTPEPR
ncbi:helix-turn-helix transcriptional regulator [Streptomyces sp. NPDC051104]|uniref:helix-turn-helix transcriptional regulator n=1 Tax=Streptomyces sp. NPDC051104 TaxID=3155044 RepID=UPI003434AC0D